MDITVNARPAAREAAPAAPPASKAVWLVAAAAFGVEMAVSARYGYVRDELYFLAAGRHLAWGYVDQPALTPLLARLDALVTGNTLAGLRALPALGFAVMIIATARMARLLGAGRGGQLLAALATACCAEYLGAMHELTTAAPDFVAWAVTLLLVTTLLTRFDPRWWVAVGAAAGIGLDAKWNIGFLIAAVLAGIAVTPAARPLLRSRYLLIGGLLLAGLAAPDFIWQARHGWPNLAVFHQLEQAAWSNRVMYWPLQVLYTSILLAPLWIGGIVWALRDARLRPLGIAAVAVLAAQFVLGGKGYYPAGVYLFCFAAGATALSRRPRPPLRRWAMLAGLAGAVSLPISLPVLPAAALARFPVQKINYDLGEEVGWPAQVQLLARVYAALPSSERTVATVLTGNYGEAGAADRYGAALGLPQAYGGQNSDWLWGPPPAGDTVAIAIGVDPALLHREFARVREVAVYANGLGLSDDEEGTPVYLATGRRGTWTADWPAFQDYS